MPCIISHLRSPILCTTIENNLSNNAIAHANKYQSLIARKLQYPIVENFPKLINCKIYPNLIEVLELPKHLSIHFWYITLTIIKLTVGPIISLLELLPHFAVSPDSTLETACGRSRQISCLSLALEWVLGLVELVDLSSHSAGLWR